MNEARPRVALADDNVPMVEALTRLLSLDCDVVGRARTVGELMQEAAIHRPDVVVLDLNLADGCGMKACRQLKAAQPEVKVIMITAGDDSHIRAAALRAGASEFVPKYLVHADLVPAIFRLCTRPGA